MDLRRAVDLYLQRTGVRPTRLGRDAVGDPWLVRDLRRGRELRPATAERLRAHLRAGGVAA